MMTSHLYHLKRTFRFAAFTTVAVFFLGLSSLFAQEFRINQFDAIDTCNGSLVDSGGSEGNTTANSTDTITICSNSGNIDQTHIRINFLEIDIDGTIEIYNGPEVDPATQLGDFLDPTANGTVIALEASAANPSGCLTFVFNSNASTAGFRGLISCVRACQPVIAQLISSEPAVEPADTGYIDVCVGQEIVFNGRGLYPEDGVIYDQSDITSTFQWNFDDGESASTPTATHTYSEPGGYTVQLFITDINGCTNTNLISQRVRVSPTPRFNLQNDFEAIACADDTLTLRGSTQFNPNPNSEILVTTTPQSFGASQMLADTTFLPDGSGVAYETTLQFNNFQAGQIVTSISDIEAICLNMEHSYAGDLELFIECPNGQQVRFIDYPDGNLFSQFFGIPIDVDADLSPGIGFDYCFVPGDPTLLTISDFVDQNGIGGGESIPAGDFGAVDPWENLIGCPLNGDWTLNIEDNLFSDNGYIFSWGISFADYLFPDLETFTVGINNAAFVETDDLLFYSADSIVAIPNAAGTQQYTYQITDDFGCTYDTTLTIQVLPVSHPDCYDCQPLLDTILQEEMAGLGEEVQTNLATATSLTQEVAFRIAPVDPFGSSLYPSLGSAYIAPIEVTNITPAGIADVDFSIESICVNLESATTGGIRLYAQAPDGTLLELSSGNGGNGSNYTQTCFSPGATDPITGASPPFTGTFMPEGNFTDLNGAPTLGTWNLLAWDVSGSNDIGTFVSWSITFRSSNNITYTWTPDNGTLSCTDCPNPVITVDGVTNTYTVVATDSYGCTETGTVNIIANLDVTVNATATNVSCNGAMDGTAIAVASGGLAPYTFMWSNEASGDTLTDLGPGTYVVTVTDANGSMDSDTVVITEPDALVVVPTVTNLNCAGDDSGSITLEITGGTAPYSVSPLVLTGLAAGTYEIVVIDSNMCITSIQVEVTSPAALALSAAVTDVTCGGEADGAIDLTVTGGTGEYTYAWSNDADTQDLDGLDGGTYSVTVTDENGCSDSLTVTVDEASDLEITDITFSDLNCNNDSSGTISITVIGGVTPYTYLWSNGETTATINFLGAGVYSVVVTDSAGCTTSTEPITVTEPDALTCEVTTLQEPDQGDNGSLTVDADGGTGDYTYLWSNGATTQTIGNLSAGDYCVTVTDENGCSTVCCGELAAFATVGDFVFFDEDRDGIQDAEDNGISGATVTINSTDGTFSESTTTDANGNYSFLVAPGDYRLTFSNPGGLAASPANQGGDDDLDSDISQATLTTAIISLALNEVNLSVDAGFFDPCDPDLTSAGTIGFNQTLCGPGNTPDQLVELTPATGGNGNYNYIWMMTTGDPEAPIGNWTPIPNTNTLNYQPGQLFESTYFTRCVRQDECPYIETNVVMIVVGDDANADISGPDLVCEGETVVFSALNLTPASNVSWTATGPATITNNPNGSINVTWGSFGLFSVTLTNVENGCTASRTMGVTVSSNQNNCFNTLNDPGNELGQAADFELNNGSGPLARVFPNPAFASEVQLQLLRTARTNGGVVDVQLYNATGSLVARQQLEAGPRQLTLTAFNQQPAGLYLVRVLQDGELETHRVIIR